MLIDKCSKCVKQDVCKLKDELEEVISSYNSMFMDVLKSSDLELSVKCSHFVLDGSKEVEEGEEENE